MQLLCEIIFCTSFIERVNNECGHSHKHGSLKDFQDKQIELETLEKLYDKFNHEFFDSVL